MSALEQLREAVIDGRQADALAAAQRGLEEAIPAQTLFDDGLMAAMREVGHLFEIGEAYVPEMLVSAHAMTAALEVLKPLMVAGGARSSGRIAIGTVKGDLHDIGKNLVMMMLEGSGFEVDDLGIDVYPQRFIEAVERGAEVVAMSALLTTTMTNMREVVDALSAAGLRERVGIVVGGAPLDQEFALAIGADGYAKDASSAVRAVEEILSRVRAANAG